MNAQSWLAWDTSTDKLVTPPRGGAFWCNSPSGSFTAVGANSKQLAIYSKEKGDKEPYRTLLLPEACCNAAFSPDSSLLVEGDAHLFQIDHLERERGAGAEHFLVGCLCL